MIGDIVVKDLDGYVMVLKKISRYVLENLDTVGRTAVEAAVWEGQKSSWSRNMKRWRER